MEAYAYESPTSLNDAVRLIAETAGGGRRVQVLAGGTDLLVQMRLVDNAPRVIVDLKRVPETREITIDANEIFIGATVPGHQITRHAELKRLLPGLVEATDLIGSTQIQGRASIGGNLCNASPAGDTIPALIANAAVCRIAGPDGERELPVEDFVVGVGRNALADGEFLVGMKIKRPGPGTGDGYLRFIPRTEMDIAVAGAGVSVTLDKSGTCTAARVSIGAVAPTALLVPAAADALIGTKCDEAALEAAGRACSEAASPISDKRGTVEFRLKVVGVLCKRAGANAVARAKASA